MTSTITRIPNGDRMVTVETTFREGPICIDYDDIVTSINHDDWMGEAPWESCDGWDHETRKLGYYDHDGLFESRGYAQTDWNNPNVLIEIDDDDIVDKWGHTRRDGEAKQVWLERVARVKRNALDQLVKWYSDGWEWFAAGAEYGDYSDGIGGIDSYSYAEEMAEECRREVAAQMELDGYTVTGKPDPPKPYNRVDAFRDSIRRNLNCS